MWPLDNQMWSEVQPNVDLAGRAIVALIAAVIVLRVVLYILGTAWSLVEGFFIPAINVETTEGEWQVRQ